VRPRQHWRQRRRGHGPPAFVMRFGCIFALMLVLSAVGASTLVSMLMREPRRIAPFVISAIIGALLLMITFTLTLRMVTRRFRAQDALRRQLLADVAHELRTPLSILQGRVEGMLDGVYPRDDARMSEVLDETRHLSRLVDDVGILANAEAGALDLRKEPVDAEALVRDTASAFEGVTIEITDALPEIQLDPVRIREVLLNLLSNATREASAVRIHARADVRDLIIAVTDNGPGIAAEDLPRIFDRFVKGARSRGSGLGLAIARKLVEAHGGTIRAESTMGEGTTITVVVPR
jgi:signal transduction histidine kinase